MDFDKPVNKVRLITPIGRLAWPNVLRPSKPRTMPDGSQQKSKFGCNLYIPQDTWESDPGARDIHAAILHYGREAFGEKSVVTKGGVSQPKFRITAFEAGDGKSDENAWGHMVLSARANPEWQPFLYDEGGAQVSLDTHSEGDLQRIFYPGRNCRLCVGLYFFPKGATFREGVAFNLFGVRACAGGDTYLTGASREEMAAQTAAAFNQAD